MKNFGKIGIVIDSTTTLSKKIIKDYNIKVVSLNVETKKFVKKETDTEDEEIIAELGDVSNLKTSSPSPNEFVEAYEQLIKEGYKHIAVFPLSKGLSSTYQSAVIARSYIDNEDDVYVFDTNLANYGIANLIESLLDKLEKDINFEDFINETNERIKNSDLMFSVMDLNHLVNGGRLSKIGGFIGNLLHIKPMVKMTDGKLNLFKKERNINNVLNVFSETIKEYSSKFKKVFVKVVDLMQDNLATKFISKFKETAINCKNVIFSRVRTVGPTFYIHLGNNGIGITVTASN